METQTGQVAWAGRLDGAVVNLLQAVSELSHQVTSAAHETVMQAEVQNALGSSLPTLESSTLLLSGISLMHRSTLHDFERSRHALETLIERHSRAAAPRVRLAKW